MTIIQLPNYTPCPFDRTLYHGGSYSWGLVRKNDDGTLLAPSVFAGYQYEAAISDADGTAILQSAAIARFDAESRIRFSFSQEQIMFLAPKTYLFDLVERDPLNNYTVRLRGTWTIKPGATY